VKEREHGGTLGSHVRNVWDHSCQQAETAQLREPGDGAVVVLHDDVDETAGRFGLAEPVSRPDWGIRVAYLGDPSGNLVELYSPIPIEE